MNRRTILTAFSAVTGAGVGMAAAVTGYTVAKVHRRHRREPLYSFTPFEVCADAEDVEFRTGDGLRLTGWWLDRPDSEWVLICAHGHQGSKADLLGIGPGLWRRGHTVLLFDFRGCGQADPGPQSLGHDEQHDLRAAVDHAVARRPRARIGLVGFSMGAATSILVGADDPRVELFVLDSPFAQMSDVIGFAYRRHRLPERPLLMLADLLTGLTRGYRMGQVRPVEVIGRLAPRPVLLLHADADQIIPFAHHEQLARAAGPNAQLVRFEGAGHCGGYFADRPGYIELVGEFVQTHSRKGTADPLRG